MSKVTIQYFLFNRSRIIVIHEFGLYSKWKSDGIATSKQYFFTQEEHRIKVFPIKNHATFCLQFSNGIYKSLPNKSKIITIYCAKILQAYMVRVLSHKARPVGKCLMRVRVPYKPQYFGAVYNLTPKFCHIFKLKICEINQFKAFRPEKCQVLIHVILMYVDNWEI